MNPTKPHRLRRTQAIIAAVSAAMLVVAFLTCSRRVSAQTAGETVGVYYIGPEDVIAEAIDLAWPYLVRVDQPELAQVIVINNVPLRETLQAFSGEIQQERMGLVLFCGPLFPQDINDLRLLLGFSTFGMDQVATAVPVAQAGGQDPLEQAITWSSAPEIRARTLITNPNLLQPVVTASGAQLGAGAAGVIQRVRGRDQTQALIVGGWTTHPSNAQWPDWPYFNYLIYRLVVDAAGTHRPLSFVDYPGSPTPQSTDRWTIAGVGLGILLGATAVYYGARRRLFLDPNTAESWQRLTRLADRSAVPQAWQQVGFHRPLAGFLAYLPLSLLLVIPTLAYELFFLPGILIPSAQGYDWWTTVGRWTLAFWILLDAGTGTAAVRHFAVTHIHQPERAPRYIQFYIWWQFLSGAAQLALVGILTAFALPAVGLAHFTYYLLARAILQFPGFLSAFNIAFRARQRFDYEQILNLFNQLITPLLQVGLILALASWGDSSYEFDPGLAGGVTGTIGLAAGILLGESLTFLLGARLHRRDGQALSALFLPTFDRQTSAEVLAFGIPWSLGAAMPAIGAVVQLLFLSSPLAPLGMNLRAWSGLIWVTTTFEIVLTGLYQDLMPALCEAIPMGYKTLLRHYVSQGIRYGAWFSFFLFAAISALVDSTLHLIPWASPEAVTVWLVPMAAWGALRWAAWLPDRMLEAAGKPGLTALLALIEQSVRLGSALVLIRLWGIAGLPAAYVIALIVRIVLGRILSGRYLVHSRIYVWQTLLTPAVSALAIYELLQLIGLIWVPPTWQESAVLSLILILPTLLLYAFLTAMLGGWDDGGLNELRRAVAISGIGRPFAWLLWWVIRLGARISPLHGRFPSLLYDLAHEEAQALTYAQRTPP